MAGKQCPCGGGAGPGGQVGCRLIQEPFTIECAKCTCARVDALFLPGAAGCFDVLVDTHAHGEPTLGICYRMAVCGDRATLFPVASVGVTFSPTSCVHIFN